MTNHQLTLKEWVLILFLGIIWGSSFMFAKIAVEALPPTFLVFLRVFIAAITLYIVQRIRKRPLNTLLKQHWKSYLVMGLFSNTVPFTLLFWGQQFITSSLASILNACTPIFTVLIAHMATHDEKLTWNKAIGVIIGFCGIVLLIGPDALHGITTNLMAQLACIGATLSYGIAAVYSKRFKNDPPLTTATGQLLAASLLIAPFAFTLGLPTPQTQMTLHIAGAVLGLALLNTAFAFFLFYTIIRTAGASNVVLVTFISPAAAILLGTLILNEVLSPNEITGLIILFAGLTVIDGRILKMMNKTNRRTS